MKVVITIKGESLESVMDPHFGRAPRFLLFDTETRGFSVHDNKENVDAAQGAGIQAAESVIRLGATAVITGQVGPKAFTALTAGGVRILLAPAPVICTASEAITAMENNGLVEASDATKPGH
jgi:predicted Fe-Mo cluster-binding NifX family protein